MEIQNIQTPALIVDKTIFDKNALAMKELLRGSNLKLRPHYKSHKCADIARMQVEGGAVGLTCAKLDEAIDLVDSGVDQGMPKCAHFETKKIVASEEHFQLHFPSKKLKVGDKVLLIPGHCCSTVNLHDKIYFVKDDKVVNRVLVTARGCSK